MRGKFVSNWIFVGLDNTFFDKLLSLLVLLVFMFLGEVYFAEDVSLSSFDNYWLVRGGGGGG